MKNRNAFFGINKYTSLKILLSIFWITVVVMPLAKMLKTTSEIDFLSVITTEKFINALLHSLNVTLVSTTITIMLSALLSWCIFRSNIKHKGLFVTMLSLPTLIPSISHGMGMIITLGSNGWLARLLNLDVGIYGFWGIVAGSVMYSFPVAFLMIYDILSYEDGTPYEAAEVMGFSGIDKFFAISLPYLRKPLISVIFATFTLIVTDYGVPLMIGGKYLTLPVMMYQDVLGMLDFGKGSVIGTILLVPALIACVLDIINRDRGNSSFVGKPVKVKDNLRRDIVAYAFVFLTIAMIFVPIISFVMLSFVKTYPIDMSISLDNIKQAINMGALKYTRNSLLIALVSSSVGCAIAFFDAYLSSRNRTKLSYILHLLSIIPLAIPGIVLGLSYIMFFKKSPIYGTFIIMFLVNIVHFYSSPYLMAYNSLGKINDKLEDVGSTLGLKRWQVFKDVIIPQSFGTLLEMFSYYFVNNMMTISAVSFLANTSTKPVALMITQFEGQMQLECAAFISMLILFVNILMKVLIYYIKRNLSISN